jgi:hypothetical protein
VKELDFKVIFGTNIIYGWGIILDFDTEKIRFRDTKKNINMIYRKQPKKQQEVVPKV